MIGLPALYTFTGLIFAAYAILSIARRRIGNAAFWGLIAASFLGGDRFGDFGNGLLVLALVALAGTGALRKPDVGDEADDGARYGNRLFLPALIIPVTALGGTFLLPGSGLIDPKQITLVSLGLGVILALVALYAWLRPPPLSALEEGRRLIDAVGWAAVLPQMLASLGAVFAVAGVGDLVGGMATTVIPHDSLFAAVLAYTLGMVLFTMIMGNAFAAFPVMTAAIGLPLLVHGFGGNPAIVCAIGMLAGFCGTLMTPMAANFNIVPAALLELKDRNAVVKAQVGTALPLLVCNIALIYWLGFR